MTVRRGDDLPLRYVLSVPTGRPDSEEMPLVIVMHGRGADANDLADIAPMLDSGSGYRFLFPNAPKPWQAAPGMTIGFSWFEGWPPESGFGESARSLFDFVTAAVKRFPTPDGKIVICGFSQGALMALSIGLSNMTEKVAGVVAMSGALYEKEFGKVMRSDFPPVLIVHGASDDVIPVKEARRARHVLEEHGFKVDYHEFEMGHFVTPESMAVVAGFIGRCLG